MRQPMAELLGRPEARPVITGMEETRWMEQTLLPHVTDFSCGPLMVEKHG